MVKQDWKDILRNCEKISNVQLKQKYLLDVLKVYLSGSNWLKIRKCRVAENAFLKGRNYMNKKIIVAHSGKQHSYQLAKALKKKDMLLNYVTTVYDKRGGLTHFVGRFLKGDNKQRFLTRRDEELDSDVVQYCEFGGLLVIALRRIRFLSKLGVKLDYWVRYITYIKTIRLAEKTNADAVIFFGRLNKKHFELKQKICPNTVLIIDVPTTHQRLIKDIFEHDWQCYHDEFLKIEQSNFWRKSIDTDFWCKQADGFLVGSSFVKKSLMMCGTEEERIKIVPYGVDIKIFSPKLVYTVPKIVTFLYVGEINRRKGIHHLLPAFEKLNRDKARLILVGNYNPQDPMIVKYKKRVNIKFMGFMTKDSVVEFYKKADVFVFPSLREGMAQVGIEAMCCGLPVICSENSGFNDLFTDGKEGFIIPASDREKLTNCMQFFIEHPKEIEKMGREASKTIVKYTWEAYHEKVSEAVCDIVY